MAEVVLPVSAGILYYANGDILSADWKDGKPDGKGRIKRRAVGKFYKARAEKHINKENGKSKQGEGLQGAENESKILSKVRRE